MFSKLICLYVIYIYKYQPFKEPKEPRIPVFFSYLNSTRKGLYLLQQPILHSMTRQSYRTLQAKLTDHISTMGVNSRFRNI